MGRFKSCIFLLTTLYLSTLYPYSPALCVQNVSSLQKTFVNNVLFFIFSPPSLHPFRLFQCFRLNSAISIGVSMFWGILGPVNAPAEIAILLRVRTMAIGFKRWDAWSYWGSPSECLVLFPFGLKVYFFMAIWPWGNKGSLRTAFRAWKSKWYCGSKQVVMIIKIIGSATPCSSFNWLGMEMTLLPAVTCYIPIRGSHRFLLRMWGVQYINSSSLGPL